MDRDELITTAAMARLKLSEEEIKHFSAAVQQMLEYFSKMMEMDVKNLVPTAQLVRENRLRKDELAEKSQAIIESMLENVPEREDRFLVIPNVL